MNTFCAKCGTRLEPGARFCYHCGEPVPNDPQEEYEDPQGEAQAKPAADNNGFPPENANEARRDADGGPAVYGTFRAGSTDAGTQTPENTEKTEKQTKAGNKSDTNTGGGPKKSGGTKLLAVLLTVIMIVELGIAGFKTPGFFLPKGGGNGGGGNTDVLATADPYSTVSPTDDPFDPENFRRGVMSYLGVTEDELNEYYEDPIEVTLENSPGNPEFIEVSFTDEEYANARTLTAPVSREDPEADFPEFDIHVDMKSWNLENETDTLIIRQMPVKTCPVTEITIYAYDLSLESGQDEFQTEVEVTFPIQGEQYFFEGALHRNEETGKWEENYYTVSEDGTHYTSYITHFSDDAAAVSNAKAARMRSEGISIEKYYRQHGQSLFIVEPFENASKYNDEVNTWLYGVSLARMPDFDALLSKDDVYTSKLLGSLVSKTGGIPAEAGLSEFCGTLGTTNDGIALLLSGIKDTIANAACGIVLTSFGLHLLLIRMASQYMRGVGWDKIWQSNKWSVLSGFVGSITVVATLVGATGLAAAGTLIAAGIFAATIAGKAADYAYQRDNPLGVPKTLEEAAYYEYLSGGTALSVGAEVFNKLVQEYPPANASEKTPWITLDIRGTGWAEAFNYLIKNYREEPIKLEAIVKGLYDYYINSFFENWDKETRQYSCFREVCKKLLYDRDTPFGTGSVMHNLANSMGVSDEEYARWEMISKAAYSYKNYSGKSWEETWDALETTVWMDGTPLKLWENTLFDKLSKEQINSMKDHARKVLYQNTNQIVYAVYQHQYISAIKELRVKLFHEVLPWLNTHVTFYIKDLSIENDRQSSTRYTSFWFEGSHDPLFNPANENKDNSMYPLYLLKKSGPILLETKMYHYLRYGCPTKVTVSSDDSVVAGFADWSGVKLVADPNSHWNDVPKERQIHWYFYDGAVYYLPIKDLKVPIVFTGESKPSAAPNETPDANAYNGTYALKIAADPLCSLEGAADRSGYSVTISGDTVTLTLPGLTTHRTRSSGLIVDEQRSGFSVTGRVISRSEHGTEFRIGCVCTSVPSSVEYSRRSTAKGSDFLKTYASTLSDIVHASEGVTADSHENMGSVFYIEFSRQTGKLLSVTLQLQGNTTDNSNGEITHSSNVRWLFTFTAQS